jgi:uncharacterized membrane protein YbhN (UPF0104 family)
MRSALRVLRLLFGVAVLVLLGQRLGGRPFLAAVHAVTGPTLAAALAIGALTTVLSAWRWVLVADGLGVHLGLGHAVGAYYRALFLNGVLPGGVLGDVHRAVRHGQDVGSVPLAAKAVALERCAGQAVLVAIALLVALVSPSALLPAARAGGLGGQARLMAVLTLVVLTGLLVVAALAVRRSRRGGSRAVGAWGAAVRTVVRTPGRRGSILAASAAVVVGHVATFVLAAHAAGAPVPLGQLLPLSLLSLLAMSVPVNVGGWGPREGVTAWAFGAAGLTAAQGLTIAVLYGLLALVASLPGAVVLVRWWMARRQGGGAGRPIAPLPRASGLVRSLSETRTGEAVAQ